MKMTGNPAKHINQVKTFIENCTILNPDIQTGILYGQIKANLRSKGRPIPENDIWIAAAAAQHGLPILTTDNHFKEIAEIDLA